MKLLIITAVLALVVGRSLADQTCPDVDEDKVNCGVLGTDQVGCENDGCCWDESDVGGIPWCFFKTGTPDNCNCTADDRVECGYYGITPATCERNGCCFVVSDKSGDPWCFYADSDLSEECAAVDEGDREDCGELGSTKETCEADECCWDPSKNSGQPWCFKPEADTKLADLQKLIKMIMTNWPRNDLEEEIS